MCGIVGLIGREQSAETMGDLLASMARLYSHRGPDDHGTWIDAARGVGLGHTRLAVIDLSPAGHQPMTSGSGRYVITYNGELYGYRDMRRELEHTGIAFRGHSDTEVLLAAIDTWGLASTLQRADGMFAFGLWDRRKEELHLVRDRMGEKPLCYAWVAGSFIFGSDLRCLEADDRFQRRIDRSSVSKYLRYGYVPDPHTVYEGAWKLPAGATAVVRPDSPGTVDVRSYWSMEEVAAEGLASPFEGTYHDAVEVLDGLIGDSVSRRIVSDVPVGVFLSGGVDSSVVAAAMTKTTNDVRTFTIGAEYAEDDESEWAAKVAAHLGTRHTTHTVTASDAQRLIPELPSVYDEPFADPSALPTCLVAQLARSDVTVALSGDGGDELFGGYNRYVFGSRMWHGIGSLPLPPRRFLARALSGISSTAWDRIAGAVPGSSTRVARPGDKIAKAVVALGSATPDDLYLSLISQWSDPAAVVVGGDDGLDQHPSGFSDPSYLMMLGDQMGYLTGDGLTKVDRAAMRVSLETRLPLLERRIVELSWRLPLDWKIGATGGKRILRSVLDRYVPPSLTQRPKAGFDPPLDQWLRGPLREWAEDLLAPDALRRDGLLRPELVQVAWRDHLRGSNEAYRLWAILMLCAWLQVRVPHTNGR